MQWADLLKKIIPRLFDSLVLMCCCFYTADNADKQNFIVFKPQRLGEEKSLAPVNESMSQQLCADDFETLVVLIKLSLWPKWWDACANRLQAWLCLCTLAGGIVGPPQVDWVKKSTSLWWLELSCCCFSADVTWGKKEAAVAVIIILLSAPLFEVVHIVEPTFVVMDTNTLLKKCKKHLWLEPNVSSSVYL